MKQLSDGLGAFWKDLKQQKNDDRVLAMTFSEFGRRVVDNASNGTDHGAAAPMFVMGSSIRQGLVSPHPSLTDLDQGDLKFVVDFRSVYASVLQNWLETPSKPILGDQYPDASDGEERITAVMLPICACKWGRLSPAECANNCRGFFLFWRFITACKGNRIGHFVVDTYRD